MYIKCRYKRLFLLLKKGLYFDEMSRKFKDQILWLAQNKVEVYNYTNISLKEIGKYSILHNYRTVTLFIHTCIILYCTGLSSIQYGLIGGSIFATFLIVSLLASTFICAYCARDKLTIHRQRCYAWYNNCCCCCRARRDGEHQQLNHDNEQ